MGRRSMTVQERLADISKRTGLSEEILRRAFAGETESVIESIKRGESATLIGRCSIKPELRSRLGIGGGFTQQIKLSAKAVNSLEGALEGLDRFVQPETEAQKQEIPAGVRVMQLSGLQ